MKWIAKKGTKSGYVKVKYKNEVICSVNDSKHCDLIAAAPEMLEALEQAINGKEFYNERITKRRN